MRRLLLALALLAPLPARALPVAQPTLCYRAKALRPLPFDGSRSLVDRYAAATVDLGAADRLCAPASYENVGSGDDLTHLVQRRTRTTPNTPEPPAQRGRRLETLFGTLTVDLVHARWAGLPARVDPTAEPPAPASYDMNHFRCWSARVTPGTPPLAGDRTVEIDDPYSIAPHYRLGRLERVCTPADVGGADTIAHPAANLACFRVRPVRGEAGPTPPSMLRVRDTLSTGDVQIGRASSLCVPATLDLAACNGDPALCDRRYTEVSYATTHNAMSNADEGWTGPNQRHGITRQLQDGIRGLMLDTHYDGGVAYLCHAYCVLGKKPLVDGLREIRRFMDLHPNEVVTIIFESYVDEIDVNAAFEAAGLLSRVSYVPFGGAWPTLREMIDRGSSLVVFTDVRGNLPWHHYVWDFAQETPYSFSTPAELSCAPNRGFESAPLFILNHFLTQIFGSPVLADQVNHDPLLIDRALACQAERGRLPNFVTVDYYDIGDVFAAVRRLNGL